MAQSYIQYETDGAVARITLNRPEVLNSFHLDMAREVQDALADAGSNEEIRAVLLTGAGRAFCAGQDLAAVDLTIDDPHDISDTVRAQYNPIIGRIRALEKPVICAVNGVAAGAGASIAFACDVTIASLDASFVLSFARIGLVPDSGATFFLPRLAGFARASGLSLLGDKISAKTAQEWGLIWATCEAPDLMNKATDLAKLLAERPTRAIAMIKHALDQSWGNTLAAQLDLEADLQGEAGRTADFREGVAAFREKRQPRFRGA